MLILLVEDPGNMTWQSFIIFNLVGLCTLSFWLGKLSTRVSQLEKELDSYRKWKHKIADPITILSALDFEKLLRDYYDPDKTRLSQETE